MVLLRQIDAVYIMTTLRLGVLANVVPHLFHVTM